MTLITEASFVVFDLETTGVDLLADRIVEIGCARFSRGLLVERRRSLVNPGCPIPAEATAVHGIKNADVLTADSMAMLEERLAARIGPPALLAGYNAAGFDGPLLNAELERAGAPWRVDAARILDPLPFVRWHKRSARSRKLVDVAAAYGIKPSGGEAHSAAVDCQMAGELLLAMVAAGLIPDDVDEALVEQGRLAAATDEEHRVYGTWLYLDRVDGRLRIGAGAHCGKLLSEVDRSYLRFILDKGFVEKADARAAMEALLPKRVGA
jgi:DNA polymerase-3 subunit epsilon